MLTFLIVCAGNEPKDKGRTIMEENLKIPAHVALILDGNGRWAKKRGLPRQLGHKKGCETLEQIVEDAARLGIRYLTVYGFSTETPGGGSRCADAVIPFLREEASRNG